MGQYDLVPYRPHALISPKTSVGGVKRGRKQKAPRKPKVIFIDNPPKRLSSTQKPTSIVKARPAAIVVKGKPKTTTTRIGTITQPKKKRKGLNIMGSVGKGVKKVGKALAPDKKDKRIMRKVWRKLI